MFTVVGGELGEPGLDEVRRPCSVPAYWNLCYFLLGDNASALDS